MRLETGTEWLAKISPCVRPTGRGETVLSHTSFGPCPRRFSTPLRIIYDYELILYRDCACNLEFEDEEFVCRPDSFIIVPPGKWHSELCLQSRNGYRYWCHFDWLFHSLHADSPVMSFATHRPRYELCHTAPDFVPARILHGTIPHPRRAYKLGQKLHKLTTAGSRHQMLLAGAVLHELLIDLLDTPQASAESGSPSGAKTSLASRTRQVLDAVASKPSRHLKLSKALSPLGFSYEHLCRVFKKAYGVSPLHYIHAQQMTRAKALLKMSDLTVAEICFAIGMSSPAYFAKIFRALIGMSPSDYRHGIRTDGLSLVSSGLSQASGIGDVVTKKVRYRRS